MSVDAEEPEDAGQQQRVDRRQPGGGASVGQEGVGEGVGVAVAGEQGAGNAAGLPAELEVVLRDADAVGVGEGDVEHADQEAGPEDAVGARFVAGVEEGFEAGKHRFRF